jgi:hypothetical protein
MISEKGMAWVCDWRQNITNCMVIAAQTRISWEKIPFFCHDQSKQHVAVTVLKHGWNTAETRPFLKVDWFLTNSSHLHPKSTPGLCGLCHPRLASLPLSSVQRSRGTSIVCARVSNANSPKSTFCLVQPSENRLFADIAIMAGNFCFWLTVYAVYATWISWWHLSVAGLCGLCLAIDCTLCESYLSCDMRNWMPMVMVGSGGSYLSYHHEIEVT